MMRVADSHRVIASQFLCVTVTPTPTLVSTLMANAGKPMSAQVKLLSLENIGGREIRVDLPTSTTNSYRIQIGNALTIRTSYNDALKLSVWVTSGTCLMNIQVEGD